jgi:hypothetical protein
MPTTPLAQRPMLTAIRTARISAGSGSPPYHQRPSFPDVPLIDELRSRNPVCRISESCRFYVTCT